MSPVPDKAVSSLCVPIDGSRRTFMTKRVRKVMLARTTEMEPNREKLRPRVWKDEAFLQSCWRPAGVGQTEIVGGGGDQGSMLSLSALPERSPQGERVPSGPPHIHLKRSCTFLTYS